MNEPLQCLWCNATTAVVLTDIGQGTSRRRRLECAKCGRHWYDAVDHYLATQGTPLEANVTFKRVPDGRDYERATLSFEVKGLPPEWTGQPTYLPRARLLSLQYSHHGSTFLIRLRRPKQPKQPK